MKKTFTKFFILSALSFCFMSGAFGQNWQYVGLKNINGSVGWNTYLYFGDLELNPAGDVFMGYYSITSGAPSVNFAMYSGSTWSMFPSVGALTVNAVDVEVQGSNYYVAYATVRSGNMYAFVKKYNGSGWSQIGDSLLLGNSSSGGYFEFLLDNRGAPTILGVVNTPLLANKQVMQYNGSSWTSVYTFSNSAGTIFRENSASFSSTNKLICSTQGYFNSPLRYFTVVSELTGSTRMTVADTIWRQITTHKVQLNASDIPFICTNNPFNQKIYDYKLAGSSWSFDGDSTTAGIGSMLMADVTSGGTVVFNTQNTSLYRSMFYYTANTRTSMDTVNISNNSLLSIYDIVAPPGSSDVYILTLEQNGLAQDVSVRKHNGLTSIGINELNDTPSLLHIYPNPSRGSFVVKKATDEEAQLKVYNTLGEIVYQSSITMSEHLIDLSKLSKGVYVVKMAAGSKVYGAKLVLE